MPMAMVIGHFQKGEGRAGGEGQPSSALLPM
jgi:hypothetical protein